MIWLEAGIQLLQAYVSVRQSVTLLQACWAPIMRLIADEKPVPAGKPQRLPNKWLPAQYPHLLGSRCAP